MTHLLAKSDSLQQEEKMNKKEIVGDTQIENNKFIDLIEASKLTFTKIALELNMSTNLVRRRAKKQGVPVIKERKNGDRLKSYVRQEDITKIRKVPDKDQKTKAIVFISTDKSIDHTTFKRAKNYCHNQGWDYKIFSYEALTRTKYNTQLVNDVVEKIIKLLEKSPQQTKLIFTGTKICLRRNYLEQQAKKLEIEVINAE